eukprot:scaffold38350_cov69-Phaeocystis_antarctica.AAC.1
MTSASANEVQMNASHASHARSSEEVDMRLLWFRRGTESVAANVHRRCWARWAAWRRPLRCAGRKHCRLTILDRLNRFLPLAPPFSPPSAIPIDAIEHARTQHCRHACVMAAQLCACSSIQPAHWMPDGAKPYCSHCLEDFDALNRRARDVSSAATAPQGGRGRGRLPWFATATGV